MSPLANSRHGSMENLAALAAASAAASGSRERRDSGEVAELSPAARVRASEIGRGLSPHRLAAFNNIGRVDSGNSDAAAEWRRGVTAAASLAAPPAVDLTKSVTKTTCELSTGGGEAKGAETGAQGSEAR